MTKKQYYIEQLEKIGRERLSNLEANLNSFEFEDTTSFQHSDFNIHFKNKDELLKSLGRQAKNRLVKLAGLAGWLTTWYPNYTKSNRIDISVDLNPESYILESDLFKDEPSTNINKPSSIYHYVYQSRADHTYEDLPLAIHLSRNSKTLQKIYRTKKIVMTVLEYAKECGLIQQTSKSYSVGHFSKKYAVNCEILKMIRELCKYFKIVIPTNFNDNVDVVLDDPIETSKSELYYKVRLDKCMRTPGLSKDDISRILTYKYQDVLRPMLSRIEIYNQGRPEEQQMHFNFNIHIKNGYNIKNGCRTWSYAGLLKTEKKSKDPSEKTFEKYFEKEFGSKPWEYDVHSSVFKINRAFNKGVWDEENLDAYKTMFDGVNRKIAKNIAMLYMFEYSGKKLNSTIGRSCPEYKKTNKNDIDDVMRYWYGHVYDYMGESLNNLVFLLEDSFYSTVDVALARKGYKFIRKFDCWAFEQNHHPEEKEMNRILARCFKTWYSNECVPLKNRLMKLEESGIKEMKNIYSKDESSANINNPSSIYHYVYQSRDGEYKNMKRKPRNQEIDNSDIPEENLLEEKQKDFSEQIKALQNLVSNCVISKFEASMISRFVFNQEHKFKESKFGFSIEDKIIPEHQIIRKNLYKILTTKYGYYKFVV